MLTFLLMLLIGSLIGGVAYLIIRHTDNLKAADLRVRKNRDYLWYLPKEGKPLDKILKEVGHERFCEMFSTASVQTLAVNHLITLIVKVKYFDHPVYCFVNDKSEILLTPVYPIYVHQVTEHALVNTNLRYVQSRIETIIKTGK